MNYTVLDRRSVVPLYYQIQQILLEQIRSGSLKPGEAVLSEQEISDRMGVSRMTARQALKSLCDQGIIYSQRGKGTFVSGIKLEKDFRHVLSFTEEMSLSGARPTSKLLSISIATADIKAAEALRLTTKDKVINLRRLRLVDGVPMAIEHSQLPLHLCPDLVQTFDPNTSLYRALAERYRIDIALTEEVAEAAVATAIESRLLQVRKRSPVFRFIRTSYLENGQPVEYVNSIYRGDRYKIVNRLIAKARK